MRYFTIALVLFSLFTKELPAQLTNLITPVSVLPQADHLASGQWRIWDKTRSHYVGFWLDAQTVTSNIMWRLPATSAAGCLTNNGLNQLSWNTGCGSDITEGILITGYDNVTPPFSHLPGLQLWSTNTTKTGTPTGNYATVNYSDLSTAKETAIYLVTDYVPGNPSGQYASFTFNGNTYVQFTLTGLEFFLGAGIRGQGNAGPLFIDGSTTVNGNILLRPGAVAGAAAVHVSTPRTDYPGLLVVNAPGTTTKAVFEIRDSTGNDLDANRVFKVIGSGDINAPNFVVSASHVSLANNSHDLGMLTNRWREGMFATRLRSPVFRPEYISGGTVVSYWELGGTSANVLDLKDSSGNILLRYDGNPATDIFSFSGDLVPNGNATYSLGTSTYAWNNVYVSTRIYGTGTSLAINGPTTANGNIVLTPGPVAGAASVVAYAVRTDYPGLVVINAAGVTTKAAFEIRDSTGNDLDANRVFKVIGSGDSSCPSCVVSGALWSRANNTYDIGGSSNRWKKQWITDIDFSGSLLVSGITAIDASRNGYFVNGTIAVLAVSSTATFTGVSGNLVIRGTAAQIDASGLGNALNINGSNSTNGNIVINTGPVSGISSLYVNGRATSATNNNLVLNDVGGVTAGSGISLFHSSAFDAAWQAGSTAAFDVVGNNASTHRFIVLQTGQVLVARTSDNGSGALLQVQGGISFTGNIRTPAGVDGVTTTLSCAGATRLQSITLSAGIVTAISCL